MSSLYVTTDEVKQTASLTGFSFADDDLAAAVNAACRAIDKICQRRFYPDADANQVRYYSPARRGGLRERELLPVDDLIELTGLETDDDGSYLYPNAWELNVDFLLEPLNAPADGEPWTHLRSHPNSSFAFNSFFPRSVRLTGRFGWAQPPDGVVEAATLLTVRLAKIAREAPFGVAAFGDQAVKIARYDPTICLLLDPYRRHRVSVA